MLDFSVGKKIPVIVEKKKEGKKNVPPSLLITTVCRLVFELAVFQKSSRYPMDILLSSTDYVKLTIPLLLPGVMP